MVKELKNKLKVSDDALVWVMDWKWGRPLASPLGNSRAPEIGQVVVPQSQDQEPGEMG